MASVDLKSATASACPGWAGPAANVPIAEVAKKISATMAKFTGYTLDGGYAEYTVADQRFCFPIPDCYSDTEAAPLLCAGLIGYRSLVKAGNGKRWASTASAPPHTSSLKWQGISNARSMPSPGPAMKRHSNLP